MKLTVLHLLLQVLSLSLSGGLSADSAVTLPGELLEARFLMTDSIIID